MRDASARNSSEHRAYLNPADTGGTHGLLCPAGALCIPERTEAAGRPLPSTFLVLGDISSVIRVPTARLVRADGCTVLTGE